MSVEAVRRGITYPQPFADLVVELTRRTGRELRILSPALDARVFDRVELQDAVRTLLNSHRRAGVRILISDVTPLVLFGHGLLNLARRLPSRIEIRVLTGHPELPPDTLVLGDRSSVLRQPGEQDKGGIYRESSPAAARDLLELFDRLWELGRQDPALRSLHI